MSCGDDDDSLVELPEASLEVIVDYDITRAEQPIDVTYLTNGDLAVTFPFINQVRILDAATGATKQTIDTPTPSGIVEESPGKLIVTTIAGVFDPTFDPATDLDKHGVSRIDLATGTVTPIAAYPFAVLDSTGAPVPSGVFPRDAVVADDGTIYMSDLAGGRIFRIDGAGNSEVWSESELLLGNLERPGPPGRPPFLTGVNGLRLREGSLYACNTDYGRLIRFPIEADGGSGAPEVIVEDPALLGFDEFEFAENGDVFAILAFRYELVRITPSGEVTVVFGPDDGIDNPAGLTRGSGGDAFLTSLGFITNNATGTAEPGVLVVRNLFAR